MTNLRAGLFYKMESTGIVCRHQYGLDDDDDDDAKKDVPGYCQRLRAYWVMTTAIRPCSYFGARHYYSKVVFGSMRMIWMLR